MTILPTNSKKNDQGIFYQEKECKQAILNFCIISQELKLLNFGNKKGQATHIAPLQPPTLATFRSWGDSAGAGRMRLAQLQK